MSRISECLERILNAVYGRDVRQSIHDSIKECYADVSSGKTIAESASENANAAADRVDTSIQTAETAATNANAAADRVDDSIDKATIATTNANDAKAACDTAVGKLPEQVSKMFSDLGLIMVDGKLCVKVERRLRNGY